MQTRSLGSLTTSALGLGCMGMTHAYSPSTDEAASLATLARAVDLGVTHFKYRSRDLHPGQVAQGDLRIDLEDR